MEDGGEKGVEEGGFAIQRSPIDTEVAITKVNHLPQRHTLLRERRVVLDGLE